MEVYKWTLGSWRPKLIGLSLALLCIHQMNPVTFGNDCAMMTAP